MEEAFKASPEQGLLDTFKRAIEAYVKLAEGCGVVITVEQVNLQPPRTGNYETRVSVRPARGCY